MIDNAQVNGFQCHKNKAFVFSPGVNAIVGSSNKGKSAIIRALLWALTNNPRGTGFVNKDIGRADVVLSVSGNTISRSRDLKTKNEYSLNDSVLTAFSSDVPVEIAETTNFDDLNYQTQLEPPFLVSESAGEISRKLNKLVNLDIIDKTLKNVEKEKREINQKLKYKTEEYDRVNKEIENYSYLEKLEKTIKRADETEKQYNTVIENKEKLNNLFVVYKKLKNEYRKLRKIIKRESNVRVLSKKESELYKINDKILSLVTKTKKYVALKTKILPSIYKINIDTSNLENYKTTKEKSRRLSVLIRDHNDIKNRSFALKEKLNKMESKYAALFPDKCPLCGK